MLNEDKTNELVTETELVNALKMNVQWSGSPDLMWEKIQKKVKPIPWYKEYRTWLATAAAAVIFIIIVTIPGNNLTNPEQVTNFKSIETETYGQVYRSSDLSNQQLASEETTLADEAPVQLFSARMAPATLSTDQLAIANIKVPEQVKAGSTINVEIELRAEQHNMVSATTPVLRLISTESDVLTLVEVTVEAWENLILIAGEPANTVVSVEIPDQPGLYELELNLGFMQDEHEIYISKNITFLVNN